MSTPTEDPRAAIRRGAYLLLIVAGAGGMLGRVLAVNSVDNIRLEQHLERQGRDDWQKQRPFLSSNDRSRWCTARALVEHGTYAIDDLVSQPNWDTIDMVKHDGLGGEAPGPRQGRLYSSKPPLLATLMAAEYWVIHKLSGATLGTHPHAIGRFMIVTINVVPLVIAWVLLARLAERYGTSDWGRLFVMGCATFGTFLTTFAVVINNHLPAAISALLTMYAALGIWYDGERRLRWFAWAGFFAAFTAAIELPALAFFAALAAALLFKAPRETVLGFLPGSLLVAAAFFGTNYAAHHSLRPPYMHRQQGDNWYDYQFLRDGKVRDSYWSKREAQSPIDQGEPSRRVYALHVLVGHHGILSLSPIWLLSVAGVGLLCAGRHTPWRALGLLVGAVSVVTIAFYLLRPEADRNYGGMTSGFRWAFWLIPLWLVAMLPAADAAAARRWSRALAAVGLLLSVLSASYPTWNPWTHPWMLDYLLHLDWVRLGIR